MELFALESQSSPFAMTGDLNGVSMDDALRLLKADAKQIIRMRMEQYENRRH